MNTNPTYEHAAQEGPPQLPGDVALHTSEITVIFTTTEATLAALRVAASLARACHAPVRLIAQQPRSFATSVEDLPRSPVEHPAFRMRVSREIDSQVDVLVCVCRRIGDLARALLSRHSLVVIGGRPSWWPTRWERLRRTLEAQGHVVLFVNEVDHAA